MCVSTLTPSNQDTPFVGHLKKQDMCICPKHRVVKVSDFIRIFGFYVLAAPTRTDFALSRIVTRESVTPSGRALDTCSRSECVYYQASSATLTTPSTMRVVVALLQLVLALNSLAVSY